MEYEEYKKILDDALVDYMNNGESMLYLDNAIKEYIFSYDNENIPHDYRERLSDKAIQSIISKQKLPSGIRLEKCIYHTQKG